DAHVHRGADGSRRAAARGKQSLPGSKRDRCRQNADAALDARRRRGRTMTDSFARRHLDETARIVAALDADAIERLALALADVRARGGRLFFLGVGGGAAYASHAVNDFRKLAGFEAYAPTDNVAELTARTNDEGWDGVFAAWLQGSRLRAQDGVFVFS